MTTKLAFSCYTLGYHLGIRFSSKKAVRIPQNFGSIKHVSLGIHHNGFVNTAGDVFTYGNPKFRHLTHSFSKLPVKIGITNIVKIECGDSFSIALDSKGVAYSWGSCGRGSTWSRIVGYRHCLGRQSSGFEVIPLPLEIKEKIIDIKAGRDHCLALTNKNLYVWGSNDSGQQGNKDLFDFNEIPVQLKFLSSNTEKIKKIDAAGNSSAALTSNGKLYVWGSNEEKNLGLDSEEVNITQPEIVPICLERPVKDFALGANTLMLMLEDSTIYVCGMNSWKSLRELQIPWNSQPARLTCGKNYFAVLATDGMVAHYGGPFNSSSEGSSEVQVMDKTLIPGRITEIVGKYELIAVISRTDE